MTLNERIIEMLRQADCPRCNGSGVIYETGAFNFNHWDCKWCKKRKALLKKLGA